MFSGSVTRRSCEKCVFYQPKLWLFEIRLLYQLISYRPSPGPLTVITKRLKFYTETSHTSGPLHFAGKVTSSSQNWGKYSTTNIGQIAIHPFILERWKHSCDDCVINYLLWPMAVTRMDTSEWFFMQSLPVWHGSLWDLLITETGG